MYGAVRRPTNILWSTGLGLLLVVIQACGSAPNDSEAESRAASAESGWGAAGVLTAEMPHDVQQTEADALAKVAEEASAEATRRLIMDTSHRQAGQTSP